MREGEAHPIVMDLRPGPSTVKAENAARTHAPYRDSTEPGPGRARTGLMFSARSSAAAL